MGIVFALAASAAWGSADFMGGIKSRTYSAIAVLFTIEMSGLVLALVVLAVVQDPFPSTRATLCAIGAGAAGIIALAAFYRALAIGTMSIVAPISATGVALPVIVGIATGDRPSPVVVSGLVITTLGVILASREVHEDVDQAAVARMSVVLALLAAIGFGTYFIGADVAADDSVIWTILLGRLVAIPLIGGALLVRGATLPRGGDLVVLCIAGCGDLIATGLYGLANTHGALSIVSVVGSLYPIATILLARAVLHERVRRVQAASVFAALTGVALIAVG
ncbi:MAG: EamA/RhaT family transporter [Actinobacteria bacterium]|nr:MAG: EamA/RhaT family transporter [Actinomycetota bacterium]